MPTHPPAHVPPFLTLSQVPSDRVTASVVPTRTGRRPQLELTLRHDARTRHTAHAAATPIAAPPEPIPHAGADVDPPAPSPAAAAIAHKCARRDALLHAVRTQYSELQAQATAALALPAPVRLAVAVTQVRLVATAEVAGAGEMAICIAFGMERANHQSEASFQVRVRVSR
jgi:hypothetical protein